MNKLSKNLLIAALSAMLLAAGCANETQKEDDAQPVKVQQIAVTKAGGADEYAGFVAGRYETSLAFQVGGRIADRLVDTGASVKKGDVLMRIDSRDITQAVNSAAAQKEAALAQLKLAAANESRYRALYNENAVSASVYDQYKTAYESALAQLNQAEAQLSQSQNSLGYTELFAPSDGVIKSVSVEAGQVVAAGQAVAVIVHDGDREVELAIPENKLNDFTADSDITVKFWALKNKTVRAKVREISPVADSAARTYKARLSLVDADSDIKLGMTASAQVNAKAKAAVRLPLAAIYQTGDAPKVWVIEDGKAHLREITIGEMTDNDVLVEKGLGDGDTVIIAGVHKLTEGQSVKPMDGEEK